MMFRPRALNMIDHSIKVNGQPLNGGLMDFAIIMFENAQKIIEKSPSFEERQVPRLYKGCSLKKWTRPEIPQILPYLYETWSKELPFE